MKTLYFLIVFFLAGCASHSIGKSAPIIAKFDPTRTPVSQPSLTSNALLQKLPTILWIKPSASPTIGPSATITTTPRPSPTATRFYDPAVIIVVPILLYHHIADKDTLDRYTVSVENFKAQMQHLQDLGFTPITPSLMIESLLYGVGLPVRPVVLTFDDGNLDNYQNAFSIMQSYGFVGAEYVIVNYLNKDGYITNEQLQEMVRAGWEIGSHGMNHLDLTKNHKLLNQELVESRRILEDDFGMKIATFAYPFGSYDPDVMEGVKIAGYTAAMGLGITSVHAQNTIFYLPRREVPGDLTLKGFTALLY